MEAIFRTLIFLFFLGLGGLGVLMLRRTLRGEKNFTDCDWRFLFGRPKDQVLTASFWIKVGSAFVVCFLLGLLDYLIIAPYGFGWYVAGLVLAVLGIVAFAPKFLQHRDN